MAAGEGPRARSGRPARHQGVAKLEEVEAGLEGGHGAAGDASSAGKAAWRRRLRMEWNALDPAELAAISSAILDHLVALPVWASARAVMLYAPLPAEVDVSPLLEWGRRRGLAVLLPWLDPARRRMEARQVRAWDETEIGPLGLRVPPATARAWSLDASTVVVVPGLAFDREGWRLGRGAGYYDRFLSEWPGAWRVGVVPARFVFPRIPHADHDRRMDWIVTEKGVAGPWPGLR